MDEVGNFLPSRSVQEETVRRKTEKDVVLQTNSNGHGFCSFRFVQITTRIMRLRRIVIAIAIYRQRNQFLSMYLLSLCPLTSDVIQNRRLRRFFLRNFWWVISLKCICPVHQVSESRRQTNDDMLAVNTDNIRPSQNAGLRASFVTIRNDRSVYPQVTC